MIITHLMSSENMHTIILNIIVSFDTHASIIYQSSSCWLSIVDFSFSFHQVQLVSFQT